MRELIGIREVIKEIQTFVISGKLIIQNIALTPRHFFLDDIPQSKVYEDNEACIKFSKTRTISPRTKHTTLPYHFLWYEVEALKIEVISINTNNQLVKQFTKGLQQGNFKLAWKALMKWYLMKGRESLY